MWLMNIFTAFLNCLHTPPKDTPVPPNYERCAAVFSCDSDLFLKFSEHTNPFKCHWLHHGFIGKTLAFKIISSHHHSWSSINNQFPRWKHKQSELLAHQSEPPNRWINEPWISCAVSPAAWPWLWCWWESLKLLRPEMGCWGRMNVAPFLCTNHFFVCFSLNILYAF